MTPLLKTDTVAKIFGVSRQTITLWALRGIIQGKKLGRSWYFSQEAVNAVMEVN